MSATVFQYRAVDRAGLAVTGTLDAPSEAGAMRLLSARGLLVTGIDAVSQRRHGTSAASPLQVSRFAHQLGVLVSAGVPLSRAIGSIADASEPGRLRDALKAAAESVTAGESLADSLGRNMSVFGEIFVKTVAAAEKSGNLVKALEFLAETLERQEETRQQVRSAMVYPACVVVVLILAMAVLIIGVMPRFGAMFASRNIELPAITAVLVGLGTSVRTWWWGWLLGVAVAIFALRTLWTRGTLTPVLEGVLIAVGPLRPLVLGTATARFCRVLGLCLTSGLNLLEAIDLAASAAALGPVQQDAERIARQVRAGGRIGAVLPQCPSFTPLARQMLTSGEEAAQLARMCQLVAAEQEREATRLAKRLSVVIEPFLIVLITGVVLVVALAVFLPMWNSAKLVGG
jgi:type II secretory pathway component PulF